MRKDISLWMGQVMFSSVDRQHLLEITGPGCGWCSTSLWSWCGRTSPRVAWGHAVFASCVVFSVSTHEMLLCACGTGTSLQETKLRTARLITFRPTHPVRSRGSTKQTAVCFTVRQKAMVSGLVNGAGRLQDQLPGFLSPRGQP